MNRKILLKKNNFYEYNTQFTQIKQSHLIQNLDSKWQKWCRSSSLGMQRPSRPVNYRLYKPENSLTNGTLKRYHSVRIQREEKRQVQIGSERR